MTLVVSFMVAEVVEQRVLRGRAARAKSRPGTTIESPTEGGVAIPTTIDINTSEDQSNFLSTKTFSEGT
jgi:hypothetical protein